MLIELFIEDKTISALTWAGLYNAKKNADTQLSLMRWDNNGVKTSLLDSFLVGRRTAGRAGNVPEHRPQSSSQTHEDFCVPGENRTLFCG